MIYNQDCMEAMKEMTDNQFDLAIVDPPYGLKRLQKGSLRLGGIKGNYVNKLSWDIKPKDIFFEELIRVSKNQIIWGANNFVLPPTEYFCIWNKKQTVDNFATAEYAWVSMGLKKPAKIFEYSIHKHNQTNKIHPTQKPVKLYEWLLMNYAKEGDTILDTHLGSGSIAIACHNLGFELTGYEIDKEYFEAAKKRIEQHKQQGRLW